MNVMFNSCFLKIWNSFHSFYCTGFCPKTLDFEIAAISCIGVLAAKAPFVKTYCCDYFHFTAYFKECLLTYTNIIPGSLGDKDDGEAYKKKNERKIEKAPICQWIMCLSEEKRAADKTRREDEHKAYKLANKGKYWDGCKTLEKCYGDPEEWDQCFEKEFRTNVWKDVTDFCEEEIKEELQELGYALFCCAKKGKKGDDGTINHDEYGLCGSACCAGDDWKVFSWFLLVVTTLCQFYKIRLHICAGVDHIKSFIDKLPSVVKCLYQFIGKGVKYFLGFICPSSEEEEEGLEEGEEVEEGEEDEEFEL